MSAVRRLEKARSSDKQSVSEDLWWLLMQVGALGRRVAERRLSASSTSPDQVQALRAIAARTSITVGELAHAMGLERNSASQLAERLVQQNLIARERSTHDRRQVYISLSDAGRAVLNASQPHTSALTADLFARLTPTQIADSAAVLDAIRQSASQVLQGPPHEPQREPVERG
jgi:DNA-binding MarR family transcriptional regulator